MFSRSSKLPDCFVEDYELILVVMTIFQSDMRRGDRIDPNCQVVTRALAKSFPEFRVADGYIPRLAPATLMDKYGALTKLRIYGEKNSFRMRFKHLIHSWLVWRDTNVVVDAWPIGGLRGFNPPIVHLQDGFDIFFVEASLPGALPNDIDERVKELWERIQSILKNLAPDSQKAPP